MENSSFFEMVGSNAGSIVWVLGVLIGALLLYLTLLVRAIIQMLKYDVSPVLLTFAFISLIPFPLILVLGVMILIIWHFHKKDLLRT